MDIKSLILLISAALFLLGSLVVWRRRDHVKLSFVSFVWVTALWSTSLYFYEFPIFFSSLTWIKIVYFLVFALIGSLFYFSFVFPEGPKKMSRWPMGLYLVLALPFIYFLFWTNLWVKDVTCQVHQCKTLLGPIYAWFGIFCTVFVSWTLFNFVRKYRSTKGIQRMQLRYLFLGIALTSVPIMFVDVVLPVVFDNSSYFWLSTFFPVAMIVCLAYAISRYRLMDVRLVIRKTMVFALSLVIVVGLTLFAIWYIAFLMDYRPNPKLMVGGGVAMAISVLLFVPMRASLQNLADKFLFKEITSYQETLKKLSQRLIAILDMKQLARTIVEEMMKIMRLDKATVLLRDGPSGQVFQIVHLIGFHEENGISLVKDNFLTQWLQKNKRPLVYEELQLMIRDQQNPAIKKHFEVLKDNMKRIEANVCLPLLAKDGISGLIVLGSKISEDAYSTQDLELLETLANQASIAIENALLYKQVHDLTHNLQEKVEEQTKSIKKLFKVKTEFLHLVSHQLRTPLTALRGLLSMWADGNFDKYPSQEKQKIKKRIFLSCERLNNITNDMLDTLDVEEGYARFKFEPVNLIKIIEDILTLLKPNFDNKGLYVKLVKPNQALPQIQADKQYLPQAFQHIIDNAEKYTKQGGLVINLSQPGPDRVQLSFKDTGIGLAKKEKQHLFRDKFFRGKRADQIYTAGSGLGLYIVKHIIEGHHGHVSAESQGKGRGTEFIITLPVRQVKQK